MAGALFGWTNRVVPGVLTAGSQSGLLPVDNLKSQHGSADQGWETEPGVLTAAAGAWFTVDAGAVAPWRAFGLFRTGLTAAATVRWRVGPAESVVEAPPLTAFNFVSASPTSMAGWSATRGGAGTGEATYFNAAGDLVVAGGSEWRTGAHDPVTLQRLGLLVEPGRTNSLRNPRAVGAAAGTPGSAPTNWAFGATGGLAWNVVGTGTEKGVPYVDVRFSGTATAGALGQVYFESATRVAAAMGQTWTLSVFRRLIAQAAGTITQHNLAITELNGALAAVAFSNPVVAMPTGAALPAQRASLTRTLTNAATATIRPTMTLTFAAGAVDVTLRIGCPQLEQGEFPTTPIMPAPNTTGERTRAADSGSVGLLAGAAATLYAETSVAGAAAGAVATGSISLSAGSAFNRLSIAGTGGGAAPTQSYEAVVGNVQQFSFAGAPIAASTVVRGAVTLAANSASAAEQGVSRGASGSAAVPPMLQLEIAGGERQLYIRQMRVYAARLTDGQIAALSQAGSTMDPAALGYDSGTIPAGVVPGFAQSVHVAPAEVSGRYCRCDIDDPANPRGAVNVPLAYAGPAASLAFNFDFPSTFGTDEVTDEVVTRGGAEYPEFRYTQRRWNLVLSTIQQSDLWPKVMAWWAASVGGNNVLFIPDPDGDDIQRVTIFGRVKQAADVTYPMETDQIRAWGATIAERL